MITTIASLIGFLSSIFPELVKIIIDTKDKQHELSIMDRQIELQKHRIDTRLDEVAYNTEAIATKALYSTYKTGINWVDALNGTVRPVVTYILVGLYCVIKYVSLNNLGVDAPLSLYLDVLWNQEDEAIFAACVSYYFGSRAFSQGRYHGK